MSKKSESVRLRESGNQFFRQSLDNSMAPIIRLNRLQRGFSDYENAAKTACNNKELCSAQKNMFVSTHHIAKILLEREDVDKCLFYMKESLDHGQKAVSCCIPEAKTRAARDKHEVWVGTLEARIDNVICEVLDIVKDLKYDRRTRFLYQISSIPTSASHQQQILQQLGNDYFHQSVTALSDGDYKSCLNAIADLYYPQSRLEEIARVRPSDADNTFIESLKDDALKTKCIAESMQMRSVADKLLKATIEDQEDLDIDALWQVIDFLRESVLLTRENDVEQEAISLSRLGKIYHEILHMKNRAKEIYMYVLELGKSLQPRNLSQEDWYRDAANAIAYFQREVQRREEEEWQRTRQQYLDQLHPKLVILKEKSELSAQKLLVWLYQEHPPTHFKKFSVNLKEVEKTPGEKVKKLVSKGILHYHPDKVDAKEHTMVYKVFCEEITKYLTAKFNMMKGC